MRSAVRHPELRRMMLAPLAEAEGKVVKDLDLFFAALAVLVILAVLKFVGVPLYQQLTASINAVMQTVNHAGEDRAGRVR